MCFPVAMGSGGPVRRERPPAVLAVPSVQTMRLLMRLVSSHPPHREIPQLSLLFFRFFQIIINMQHRTWERILPTLGGNYFSQLGFILLLRSSPGYSVFHVLSGTQIGD